MAYTTINKSTDHFNTKLWTGTGSSNALTGLGFQPDWVWIKNRTDNSNSHTLQDVLRGAGNTIISNTDEAQTAEGAGDLTAFGSDGFTVGTNGRVNGSGKAMVAWNWKANGAGSANTDGSINTTATSANTTSGFSIVQWTGTGANATVGHGLGVAPKMIIFKNLNTVTDWDVFHGSIANTERVHLNTTGAKNTAAHAFNSTSPTTSVFSVGTADNTNKASSPMIAYCFAEKRGYSKFGSYTGNGSADGTFVYTGFKPAFVIAKMVSGIDDWRMVTENVNSRNTASNEIDQHLYAHGNNAASATAVDFLSTGMKIRSSSGGINGSGSTFIYMAFAAAPLVGSNDIPATAR
jgi:hypothetical protein